MKPERKQKLTDAASFRQFDLAVLLENVYDAHNIGAVMRTCESIGVHEIYVLYNDQEVDIHNLKLGKRTTAGSRRWMKVYYFEDTATCFEAIGDRYAQRLATHLNTERTSLYELDLTQSTLLLFGNESDGLSDEVLKHCTGNFLIPQVGLTRSLNISVACAVTLYEAFRQKEIAGHYDQTLSPERQQLLEEYLDISENKDRQVGTLPIDASTDKAATDDGS